MAKQTQTAEAQDAPTLKRNVALTLAKADGKVVTSLLSARADDAAVTLAMTHAQKVVDSCKAILNK